MQVVLFQPRGESTTSRPLPGTDAEAAMAGKADTEGEGAGLEAFGARDLSVYVPELNGDLHFFVFETKCGSASMSDCFAPQHALSEPRLSAGTSRTSSTSSLATGLPRTRKMAERCRELCCAPRVAAHTSTQPPSGA